MRDWRPECKTFATEITPTKLRLYGLDGQDDYYKIWMDNYYGKLAEFAAWNWLLPHDTEKLISPPLMTVLDNPNWNADLNWAGYPIAVKSCYGSSFERYGYSWTFQIAGRRVDPIYKSRNPNHKVIFVACPSETEFVIYGVSDAKRLGEMGAYGFKDGVDLPYLKATKRFVRANETKAITEKMETIIIEET